MSDEYIPDYANIITYYGEEAQMKVAIEECSELIQAICKLQRAPKDRTEKARKHYIEELTDVVIMTNQLRWVLSDIEYKEFVDMYRFKIKRQLKRIERSKKETECK